MSGLGVYDPAVGILPMGDMWSLTKGPMRLACTLSTHPLGWELRIVAGTKLMQSKVCKSQPDVFTTADHWKADATEKGWA